VIAALALLHGAGADTTFAGKSDQGLPVSAVVRAGKIDRIKLNWAADCADSGWVWGPLGTIWFNRQPAPFDVSGKRYKDHGKVSRPFQTGTVEMSQRLSGRLGARSITGMQKSTVRLINADGKQVDKCSSTIHFTARPKKASRGSATLRPF
jgi:hypothetical protein